VLQLYNNNHIKNFAKTYVDAIEQNALNRRVSGLSGGGTERSRRWVDGSSTWLRLWASSTGGGADGGGSRDYLRLPFWV